MEKFFSHNTLVIDEKINAFRISNVYRVYDSHGNEIGAIQERKSFFHILLGMFLSKNILPFKLNILNDEGKRIAQLKRGSTLIMSRVRIFDEAGHLVGAFQQKFSWKPKFKLLAPGGEEIATIKGDWRAWNFNITDTVGNKIGSVNKKWNGVAKELFTTADKYVVNISPTVTNESHRIAIASVAAAIDMILKEN